MRKLTSAVAAISAAGFFVGSAEAGIVLPASTILQDFNAIIFTNASTTSDIEGAAVIGGNFSGATVYNHPDGNEPDGFGALTVYGNTSGNPINVNNGGNVYIGGTNAAIINLNGGSYIGAPAYAIADFETSLNALSSSMALMAANSTLPTPTNNEVIKATPGADGVAVFNINTADLAAIPSYKIDMNGAQAVIFNVSGSSLNFTANLQSGTTGANNIIWNFYDATSLNFQTQFAGSVIAPNATVSNQNQIDGTLVARAWVGNGELHDYGFDGPLPPSAAPEPDTWLLMIAGFSIMGMALRLRRRLGAQTA